MSSLPILRLSGTTARREIHRVHPPLKRHPRQLEILSSPARRVVVCAGRRFGKTTLAARKAIDAAVEGRRVLYLSPIVAQSDAFWGLTTEWLSGAIVARDVVRNETIRSLLFVKSGGRIRCRTAHDPDSLRGDTAEVILLDEFSLMDPVVWEQVVAPMTLDANAQVWFISTPKPGGPFKAIYFQAKANEDGRWQVYHATSYDNPFLSTEALEEIVRDMTVEDVAQEIRAEFIVGEGAVFTRVNEGMWGPDDAEIALHKAHPKAMTIDWGQKQDYTAISIGCKQCRKELKLIRWKGIEYPEQQSRIRALRDHWKPETIYAESNAMGLPNIQALQAAGVEVSAFDTTAQSKRQIIQGLKLALERGEWKFVNNPAGILELEGYEASVSKTTGQVQYSAPSGMHDDSVIARALLVYASAGGYGW